MGARRLEPEAAQQHVRSTPRAARSSGRATTKNQRTGVETKSAIRSAWLSAMPFGTSSPITTCRYVTTSSARITARNDAITASKRVREHLLAEGADRQRADRHGELHRRDEPRRVLRDAQDGAGALVALVLELHDPGAPRRDEAVLGRDEERRSEAAGPSRASISSSEGHTTSAPLSGARVLGGRSSSKRISRPSIATRLVDTNVCSMIGGMRTEYREEPCKVALNHVKGMPFDWSLNPYMGCVHRCTFCYVRAFELRADRPADERYGTLDPRQGEHRRACCARSSPGDRGTAARSRSAPRPTRTSPPKGATG